MTKILVAEDDTPLLQALQSKLADADMEVVPCANGREAIDALKAEKFDCVLLDLIMPEVDGFAVLEAKQKTDNANTITYVVTNLGADEHCLRAKSLGAVDCFVKSRISLKEVVQTVTEATA